jgi:YbbR domain-containing protein
MAKTPTRTAGLKIISVLLAVLLWLYVVNQDQISTKQNYTDVNLQYYNLPSGLTVSGPQTVSVRLWGTFKQSGQIIAYVDLASLSQGEYNLPVKVKPVNGAMFTSVKPDKVRVQLKRLKENTVSVEYEIRQNPPSGFELVDVVIEPSKCLIKGDQSAVNRVARVVAPLELGQVKDISSFKVDLVARDANGDTVSGVVLVPGTVSVYSVVEQQKATITFPIQPQFTGKVPDGYQMTGYKLDHDTVSVLGPKEVLNKLTTIDVAKIDLTDKKESFSQAVNVTVPPGTNVYPAQVTVNVDIVKLPEKEVP